MEQPNCLARPLQDDYTADPADDSTADDGHLGGESEVHGVTS